MGRKNKKYYKDLHRQAYEKLTSMQAFGESKTAAKRDGTMANKIFSYSTYKTYWKQIKQYLKWLQKAHPECTTLKSAKRYVNEWLQTQVDAGLSSWSINLKNSALCKLFEIRVGDLTRFQCPPRRREDIKRSRSDTVRDKHFSVTNNAELITFAQGTGARRNVLERLEGRDLWTREQMEQEVATLELRDDLSDKERKHLVVIKDALAIFPDDNYFVHHRRDKGGRFRMAPIIGPGKEKIIERFRNTPPNERVWWHVPGAMDVHHCRAQYCVSMYKKYARPLDKLAYDRVNRGSGRKFQSEIYHCRRDEAGKKLDKVAMAKCSHALGHSRLDVIAENYLYNM